VASAATSDDRRRTRHMCLLRDLWPGESTFLVHMNLLDTLARRAFFSVGVVKIELADDLS